MSICNSKDWRNDGWWLGSYVYFLTCESDAPGVQYHKIGITDRPTHRLYELAQGCVLKPTVFGVTPVYSRKVARMIENHLHRVFRPWLARGEWFRFSADEPQGFIDILKSALRPLRSKANPLDISTADVQAVLLDAKRRAFAFRRHHPWRKGTFIPRSRVNTV